MIEIKHRLIAIIIILSLALNVVACDKSLRTEKNETDTYIHYSNYRYANDGYKYKERQLLDVYIPKNKNGNAGLVLYIHGGGWIGGDKDVYAGVLESDAEKGYVAASINYRYADGKGVTCENILDDIERAVSSIKSICSEYGVEVNKVMLLGGSAGAHLALMYAYSRAHSSTVKPVAVASYSGPTDLSDANFYNTQYVDDIKKMIYKVSGADLEHNELSYCRDLLDKASPITYVNSQTVPTLILHGIKDDVVPYSNATSLYDALKNMGVKSELVTFDNSGHGLDFDPLKSEYAENLVEAYKEEYLKK